MDECETERLKASNGDGVAGVAAVEVETIPLHTTQEMENAGKDSKTENQWSNNNAIIFPVESVPPWYITLIYAFQQVLSTISGPVSAAFIIRSTVCGQNDSVFLAELIGTSVFMSGLCTLLQVTFGLRLPVIQGSSWVYLPVLTSLMSTPQYRCPDNHPKSVGNETMSWINTASYNDSSNFEETEALWKPRMREASGALIAVALFEVILGCTGLVGVLMRFIGPLTVAPAVSLIGLSLASLVGGYCSQHWAVSLSTAAVFILVSQLLKGVLIPFPAYNRSRGFHAVHYPVFRLFPPIFAIAFGWILCLILTSTGKLPSDPDALGYRARTDIHSDTIANNKWFFFPYPGMWGFPTFSVSVMLGMLSATICTIVESIGDYYATARACGIPPPPMHAMNRGIAMEGFGSVICGLLGAGHATTSYSQTAAFMPLTGMASRVTWQVAGVLLMLAGIFGKFGAVLASIPDPVLGGTMLVCLGMVVSVGLSNVQFVDLSTGRNMMILGTSLMLGLVVPDWIRKNTESINTGSPQVDQMLTILLGTPMFVGGFVGTLLDNTMPGSLEERGITAFHQLTEKTEKSDPIEADKTTDDTDDGLDLYDFPFVRHCSCRKWTLFTYLPFLPCYQRRSLGLRRRLRCSRHKETTL